MNNCIHIKRAVNILLVVILLFTSCSPLCMAQEKKTVRVGYIDYSGFIEQQTDGTYTGYAAEYLYKISEYTDYKYEFVYGEWEDLLQKLKNKEIDLLCNAQFNQQRAEHFDYSQYPIGYTQGLLYTTTESDLCYEDFVSFNNMNVGILKATAMKVLFEKYCQEHNFKCNIIEFNTEEEIETALISGQIDSMCSEHLANHRNLSLLAQFGADAYYIISYKDSTLIPEINFALQQIKTDVDFETTLYHKYYDSSTAATTLTYTTQEKNYIANAQTIRVGLNTERAPFSQYDEKTGEFKGVCVDILNEISKRSGLVFEFVPQPLGVRTSTMLDSGDFDIICGVEHDNFIANEKIIASDSFIESSIVPIAKSGKNIDLTKNIKVAIPYSFQALQKTLNLKYPNMEIMFYNNNRDCLDAVNSDEADVFIQNTHILSLLLQEPKYEGLAIIPVEIMSEHTSMAMLRSTDPELCSIINKVILSLDQAKIGSSLIEHTFATPYKYTTSDLVYKFRGQITIIAVLISICFLLLVVVIGVRKKNEKILQKKNSLLADAVTQADNANYAKSQFLSSMSHEIRTPMNAIVGLTTIARQHRNNPDEVESYLNKIETSSKVLLNIVNDILDMSAIESNKLKISKTEFDIKQVLTSISTIYYPQCVSKGIKFEMATNLDNEYLVGDSLRVNQILLNLISNAYKFTESGGTIRVAVQETAKKDSTIFLEFTVSDTGCGMTDDMQQRLFRPFEQETNETAKKHGGSGLGLSIAKNLVDLMNGAISVHSEKDVGTTFTVDLPFEIAEGKNSNTNDVLKSLRVLVVDDDQDALEYTAIVLKRLGANFDLVNSGAKAIEAIRNGESSGKPYDVCLIDWAIPDMNGIEVTKQIRKIENNKSLIIIVSAYDLNEVQQTAKDAGVDHFVTKPLFQSTLFNVLMSLSKGALKKDTTSIENYDFTGRKVLIAEDNELNAEIAIELLNMANMKCEHVENGQLAVEKFRDNPAGTYDAILMDVQMPVMNGYDATRAIRELERYDSKTIPILAMTANAFTEDVAAAISSGMNGHIAKPIDTKILYDALYKAINN